jgi:hypothetical protein
MSEISLRMEGKRNTVKKKSIGNIRIWGSMASVLTLALISVAAYKTHTESDSDLFFQAYPQTIGTRLDGCEVCHSRRAISLSGQKKRQTVQSACNSCHFLTDYGRKQGDTLTPFGHDYLKSGRNAAAFSAIAAMDSDGDGTPNAAELDARTNPGDPQSAPGKKTAPFIMISYEDLIKKGLPVKEQTIFVNVSKSKSGDSYSTLRGFALIDVLKAAGIAPDATGVDVISIDGYMASFTLDQLRKSYPQAAPVFGLGTETLGECGWVRYEAGNLKEGTPLPPANVLLTFEESGKPYEPARIDEKQRLVGNGPFRVVAPQMNNPGVPDISSKATEACIQKAPEQYRFHRDYEKNSDYCVKAAIAIRVHPLPSGAMDIDWPQYAKKAIETKGIVIFGNVKAVR